MGLPRIGGETPIVKYGLTITAESPAGTSNLAPVVPGDLFVLVGAADADSNGYKLTAATAGDDASTHLLAMAIERSEDAAKAIGVMVLTGQATQIRRLKYNGAAPVVGNSVEIAAGNVRCVTGTAFARGKGLVLVVDTAATEVEVLI